MSDEKISQSILKFVRQMKSDETADELKRFAVEKNWLDEAGEPTKGGRELFQSFQILRGIEGGAP